MLTLYHYVNSVASQKARIVLHSKKLEFETREVALFEREQFSPEYLKLNRKGYVPTLVHDGKAVGESTLICEYLEDTIPDLPLRPADPHERAHMRQWSKTVDDGLHVGVTMISFSAMFRERMKTMPDDVRERRFLNIGDPARRARFESSFEHGVNSPFVFRAIADVVTPDEIDEMAVFGGNIRDRVAERRNDYLIRFKLP